jgi:hypothetical protein
MSLQQRQKQPRSSRGRNSSRAEAAAARQQKQQWQQRQQLRWQQLKFPTSVIAKDFSTISLATIFDLSGPPLIDFYLCERSRALANVYRTPQPLLLFAEGQQTDT